MSGEEAPQAQPLVTPNQIQAPARQQQGQSQAPSPRQNTHASTPCIPCPIYPRINSAGSRWSWPLLRTLAKTLRAANQDESVQNRRAGACAALLAGMVVENPSQAELLKQRADHEHRIPGPGVEDIHVGGLAGRARFAAEDAFEFGQQGLVKRGQELILAGNSLLRTLCRSAMGLKTRNWDPRRRLSGKARLVVRRSRKRTPDIFLYTAAASG